MKYSSLTIPLFLIVAIACNNYCSTADESTPVDTANAIDTTVVVSVDTVVTPDSVSVDTTK